MKTWSDNIMFVYALRTDLIKAWSTILTCNYWPPCDVGLESETGSRHKPLERPGLVSTKSPGNSFTKLDALEKRSGFSPIPLSWPVCLKLPLHSPPPPRGAKQTNRVSRAATDSNYVGEIVLWCDGLGERGALPDQNLFRNWFELEWVEFDKWCCCYFPH